MDPTDKHTMMQLTKPILKANRMGTGDRLAEVMHFILRAGRQECSDALGCSLSPSCRAPSANGSSRLDHVSAVGPGITASEALSAE
jgi:hypothetical protein